MNPYRALAAVTRLLAAPQKTSMAASLVSPGFLVLLASVMAASAGWAQEANQTPSPAPLSSRFAHSMRNQSLGRSLPMATTREGRTLGLRASPMDFSHLMGQPSMAAQTTSSLPSSYDLRNVGKVSPVKDQLQCGDCWAFATYGSLESVLLADESWNFSENNLNNLNGFDFGSCQGGNGQMSTAYLARWAGPVNASADPDPTSCSSTNTCTRTSPANLPAQKHVQGVYFIPARANSLDNSNLKSAILNYGGVDASISADELEVGSPYWNVNNAAYYYNGATVCTGSNGKAAECPIDHSITLVGWDDAYPAGKFSTAPPGNGAFLAKNSWGTGFGDAGFFWISYYDAQLAVEESYVFNEIASTTNYSTEYEYDPLGLVSAQGYGTTTAWAANVFTASANGQLAAVATYALANGTAYSIEVYTNASNGPTSGSLAATTSGTLALAGYNTIELPSSVALSQGQKFSVVIQLTTPGYNYPIPVEYAITGYSSKAKASPGQSYISANGSTWQDTTAIEPTMNVALKAFSNDSAGLTNPVPVVSSISPAYMSAGGAAFTLTVNGSGFVNGSTAYWGATALTTSYVSATQLAATVTAAEIGGEGVTAITVQTPAPGGGSSNALQFEVNSSGSESTAPTLTAITMVVTAGSSASYAVTLPSTVESATVSCLNLPTGAACSYASGTLTITTTSATPKGTYQITVNFTETLSGVTSDWILLPILLLPLMILRKRLVARGSWVTAYLGMILLAVSAFSVVGCGGGAGGASQSSTTQTHQVVSSGVVTLTIQ